MSENTTHLYPDVPSRYAVPIAQRSAKIGLFIAGFTSSDAQIVLGSRPLSDGEARGLRSKTPQGRPLVFIGTVVKVPSDGYKSALYGLNTPGTVDLTGSGIATDCIKCLAKYREDQEKEDSPTRIKDPKASDSNGQFVVENPDEMYSAVNEIGNGEKVEVVAMPNLQEIKDRISVGAIKIGKFVYLHIGREKTATYNGKEVYGGTNGVVVKAGDNTALELACIELDIDPSIVELGLEALRRYCKLASSGLVSVDVISGFAENGEEFEGVVDVTPRIGGATPMQIVAIEALRQESRYQHNPTRVLAKSHLLYNSGSGDNLHGTIFADTTKVSSADDDTLKLIIAANVTGVK